MGRKKNNSEYLFTSFKVMHCEGLFSEQPFISQLDQIGTLARPWNNVRNFIIALSSILLLNKMTSLWKKQKKLQQIMKRKLKKEIRKIRDAYMSRISIYFVTNDFEGLLKKKLNIYHKWQPYVLLCGKFSHYSFLL